MGIHVVMEYNKTPLKAKGKSPNQLYDESEKPKRIEIDLKKQFAQKLDYLLKEQNGNASKKQRENLDRNRTEAIEAAKHEALLKTEVYKRAAEDVFDLSREKVKKELAALKALIDSDTISGEAKKRVEAEIGKLEVTLQIAAPMKAS